MKNSQPLAPRGRTGRARLLAGALAAGLAIALAGAPARAAEGVVNVNTATLEELARLPGIGEAKARAILELRKERGAFRSVDQLRDVKGIGDAALERIRPHVVTEGKTTLN
jgi:competence protein ComEA